MEKNNSNSIYIVLFSTVFLEHVPPDSTFMLTVILKSLKQKKKRFLKISKASWFCPLHIVLTTEINSYNLKTEQICTNTASDPQDVKFIKYLISKTAKNSTWWARECWCLYLLLNKWRNLKQQNSILLLNYD